MIYVLTWIFTLLWIIPLGLTKTKKVSCPGTDYAQLNETCYYFYNNPKSWWQAQNSCEEKGGALLIFQEKTEIRLVKKEVKKIAKELDDTVKFWLGLKHNSEDDKFYWADGTGLTRKNWIERLDKKVSVPGQCVVIQAKENSGAGSKKWETRSCDNKLPFICEIELSQSRWAVWSSWGDCSTSCDTGTKKRSRRCLRPTSASDPCKGSSSESKQCNKQECPATNVWSKWGDWGSCSLTCGNGVQTRRRSCKSDQRCSGEAEQERQCVRSTCPEWGTWSKWSSCSVTCGKGKKERSRTCLNSRQSSECKGNSKETSSCTQNDCPEWGAWSDWGSCSVTCGEGEKQRTRKCLNSRRGSECEGNSKEVNSCKQKNCPTWGSWTKWSPCSVTCGQGKKERTRKCLNSNTNKDCKGNPSEGENCSIQQCRETKEKLKTKKKTKLFRSRVIRAKRNRGIIGYEIYRTQIKRVVRCALTCLRVSNCRSINFQFKKPKKKNGGETLEERVCILNSVSSTDQPDSIQELPGYKFYDLGEFFGDETDVG